MRTEKVGPSNSRKHTVGRIAGWGAVATSPILNHTTNALAATPSQSAMRHRPPEAASKPLFASRGADAQDLGFGDAVRDVGDDYLLVRGYELLDMG